jgi:hypothetical protein
MTKKTHAGFRLAVNAPDSVMEEIADILTARNARQYRVSVMRQLRQRGKATLTVPVDVIDRLRQLNAPWVQPNRKPPQA